MICDLSFLLDYLSAQGAHVALLSLSQGVLFKVSRNDTLIMCDFKKKQKKTNPNLYGEHDQDVPNDSDQTERSSDQDDEHYFHGCVRTSREETRVAAVADVGSMG